MITMVKKHYEKKVKFKTRLLDFSQYFFIVYWQFIFSIIFLNQFSMIDWKFYEIKENF